MATRPFHHGALRAALLDAARTQIERDGYEHLSLRDLAAQAGVSAAAPYRHFADRRTLLSLVAAQGFDELTALYREVERQEAEPFRRLLVAGREYIRFARHRPQLFRLMFVSDLLTGALPPSAELVAAADPCYAAFEAQVAACLPRASRRKIQGAAIACWSTTYGFALLEIGRRLKPFMREDLDDDALMEAALAASLAGLAASAF